MSVPTTQATFAATLVDEWVRAGLTDAVICPGSRSTPLALALFARPELRVHVRLDERGAGFYALGLGLASGRPAVVCVTSGTAAVELHPAVVEASHARVPLIVCSADRPPELHHVEAPQTIDQDHLYGRSARWYCDPGVADDVGRLAWRSIGSRAVWEATAGPDGPGPVHLNLPFRDPLVGEPAALPAGRADGGPWHQVAGGVATTGRVAATSGAATGGAATGGVTTGGTGLSTWPSRRGVVVAGAGCGSPERVLRFAARLGWPVLADPRSGCRRSWPGVIAAADAFLRDPGLAEVLSPEIVLVLGHPWASKVLNQCVASTAEVVTVDRWWQWRDADRALGTLVQADPDAWLESAMAAPGISPDPAWRDRWMAAEAAAQAAIDRALLNHPLSEPAVARALVGLVPPSTTILAASSMPVRDLEWYAPAMADPPRVVANRGANGIDGLNATAQGLAAGSQGPVVALLGDLAFLHDASSLVRLRLGDAEPVSCTLVVLDNGGGGIFSFLSQAAELEEATFETLFGTAPGVDPGDVARGFGWSTTEVNVPGELAPAITSAVAGPGFSVVRVRVPSRAENVVVHEQVHDAVADAVATAVADAQR